MINIGDLVRIKYTINIYDSVPDGHIGLATKPSVLFHVNHVGVVLSRMDTRPRTYTQVLLPAGVGWVWSGDLLGV